MAPDDCPNIPIIASPELPLRIRDESAAIADVGLLEYISIETRHFRHGIQIAGIGELVKINDPVIGVIDDVPNQCRADEAGAAGGQNFHL